MGGQLGSKTDLSPDMQKYTNFSPGQINRLKERFEMMSDNFGLTKEEFMKTFKCSAKEADLIFSIFDMDENGVVDSYEFICGLAMLSQSSVGEKAELLFNLYDFDENKHITRDELVILMYNTLSSINQMSGKSPPTTEEVEKKTDEIFMYADKNKDKRINLEEWTSYVTKNKEILKLLDQYGMMDKDDLRPDFGGSEDPGEYPDCDSDIENETCKKDWERSDKQEKIKQGIEYKTNEDGSPFEEEEMGGGDEFMACKPWIGVVENSVPSGYKPSRGEADPPDASLELEYIHGYRCHDTRNNLRYTQTGDIVYHTAAVGIVLDGAHNTQQFFLEHTDDITCMAIHPSGKYVATGEVGRDPLICVWNCVTMQCEARISGVLHKGITQVAFSADGTLLAASAADDSHCIAVYDWEKCNIESKNTSKGKSMHRAALVATGKGSRASILSLVFNPDTQELVACCLKELVIITFKGGVWKTQKGIWGRVAKQQAILCGGFCNQALVTGVYSGELLVWKGRSCSKAIQGHKGVCGAMWTREANKGLVTGGNDGLLIVWDHSLARIWSIDIKADPKINSKLPRLTSVSEYVLKGTTKSRYICGTRGGEIIEIEPGAGGKDQEGKGKVLMKGHFKRELWGLATHPKKQEFASVGQDSMLGIWDIPLKRQKVSAILEGPASTVAYSGDGTYLAIGFENGQVMILEPEKMTDQNISVSAKRKDRDKGIVELKFSPNNTLLAVGARDPNIILYNVADNFKKYRILRKNLSTVPHFDFSCDSGALMSNSTSYDILFHDTNSGKQLPSGASMFRDEKWATWTCTLGWPVQGIFPPCTSGDDINACDRSPDEKTLVTADDFGKVKLFKYPNPVAKTAFMDYIGHSSHVTNIRFSGDASHVISTGGNDKAIFQWKYHFDKEGETEGAESANAPDAETDPEEEEGGGMAGFEEEEMGGGDEFMAVKPFLGEVLHSTPSDYKPPRNAGAMPDGNLQIRYVHGYRSFDTRNNVKYCKNGEIVYHTASLGVVLDPETKPDTKELGQTYFNLHEEDIVSLAIHPQGHIVATGQMAQRGKASLIPIYVWSTTTKEVLACLKGFHRRAIRQLAFSPSGARLLSVGEDDDHSIAVYDWASDRILGSSKVDRGRVLDASFKTENELVAVGLKTVKFFTMNGRNMKASRGLAGGVGKVLEPQLCCAFAFQSKTCVSGGKSGVLYYWNGRSVGNHFKAHEGAIWALCPTKQNKLWTGGNDCVLKSWDEQGTCVMNIDIKAKSKLNPIIRAIDQKANGNILVGTKGSEIIQLFPKSPDKHKILVRGHYEGELWALATHPKENRWATACKDKTLRIWEIYRMASAKLIKEECKAMDWSQNGRFIILGSINGLVMSYEPDKLNKIGMVQSSFTNQHQWIEDIKISPSCQLVAFGAHGGVSPVEVMSISETGANLSKRYTVNVGLTSALTHIDWCIDSSCVVVNSQAYELKFADIVNKSMIPASGAKDLEWFSWTCVLGFPVQGIFRPCADGTDVNAVCRAAQGKVMATGDDFGHVNLFVYPSVVKNSGAREYGGHSSHVTNVKFMMDDNYLVSTGGLDKTIIVWNTDFGSKGGEEERDVGTGLEDSEEDEDLHEVGEEERAPEKESKKNEAKRAKVVAGLDAENANMFEVDEGIEGTEFMATKAWIGALKEPTGYTGKPPRNQSQPPKADLELEYVHGYRSRDTKSNLRYMKGGDICYHAAGVGIVMDLTTNTQRFFIGHTDDITAMAFHPDGVRVATGELGANPVIYIWDINTCQKILKLTGKLKKGIRSLAFSPNGDLLAAVAMDNFHQVAIYDTHKGTLIGLEKGDTAIIVEVAFKSDTEFYTVGIKHLKFWTIQGRSFVAKKGIFRKANNILGCVTANNELCLTGSASGELISWRQNSIASKHTLHKKPMDCVSIEKQIIVTGGRDGIINILNKELTVIMKVDFTEQVSINPGIRSATLDGEGKNLLVGTLGSEIFELSIDATKKIVHKSVCHIQGHYSASKRWTNEVWGLAVHTDNTTYVSCSDDATLRVWDLENRCIKKLIRLDEDQNGNALPRDPKTGNVAANCKGRCCDISPNGKYLAVGFMDGSFRIYDAKSYKMLNHYKERNEELADIKYSPDGQSLAIGSNDQYIDIYSVPTYKRRAVCKGHTSSITHLDWSEDSSTLHSNSKDYELLFWSADDGKQQTSGATGTRDEEWASWSCVIGWPVQGIWPKCADGTDINSLGRSHNVISDGYKIIATGDDFGFVRLLRYPCIDKGSNSVKKLGHSSHVTNIKFLPDDGHLVSAGGNDECIFQWKLTKPQI